MGVERLAKITLLAPRSELPKVVKELTRFEWFHPTQPKSVSYDPNIDALVMRAYGLFIELDSVIKEMRIKVQPDVMEMIVRGVKVRKEKFVAKDWEDFVARTEAEAKPLLTVIKQLISDRAQLEKALVEESALKEALMMVSEFFIDLDKISRLKRIRMIFATIPSKDVGEIRRSLPEQVVVSSPLTKAYSALLIAGSVKEADRVDRVLRSFEVKPFTIRKELPQNPAEAYKVVEAEVAELEERLSECIEGIEGASEASKQKLLILYEAAKTAHSVLDQVRKSGDLKKIAIIEGYIPASHKGRLMDICRGRWPCFTGAQKKEQTPSLFTNRGFIRPFENITMNQGPPRYGEIDPTPLITFVFPIFYGMMFGDLGHGLILFLAGQILRIRGDEGLKKWGSIFSLAGLSAMVVGTLIGEVFGQELGKIIPLPGPLPVLELVERVHHQFNLESVVILLQVSILMGVTHITVGLLLDLVKTVKEKDYVEAMISKLPTLLLYVFGFLFALAFISAGYSFGNIMTSTDPTHLIGLPVNFVAMMSLAVAVTCMVVLSTGKALAIKLGKLPKESLSEVVMVHAIETLFERIPGFLANSVSYARLGILLVVHSALLFVLNKALEAGLMGVPILLLGNAGVIALEALIVYIQDLRLHLYEWFTKFYEGTGEGFKRMTPSTTYVDIKWE